MEKVLYVDDARSMRRLVELVLEHEFDLTICENGQQAIDAIDQQKFDVILSDVNMPVMNGIEFLEKLRQHENSKFTPVLMLTTEASREMKEQGKRLGATGWIVKPFDPAKLGDTIRRVLN